MQTNRPPTPNRRPENLSVLTGSAAKKPANIPGRQQLRRTERLCTLNPANLSAKRPTSIPVPTRLVRQQRDVLPVRSPANLPVPCPLTCWSSINPFASRPILWLSNPSDPCPIRRPIAQQSLVRNAMNLPAPSYPSAPHPAERNHRTDYFHRKSPRAPKFPMIIKYPSESIVVDKYTTSNTLSTDQHRLSCDSRYCAVHRDNRLGDFDSVSSMYSLYDPPMKYSANDVQSSNTGRNRVQEPIHYKVAPDKRDKWQRVKDIYADKQTVKTLTSTAAAGHKSSSYINRMAKCNENLRTNRSMVGKIMNAKSTLLSFRQ